MSTNMGSYGEFEDSSLEWFNSLAESFRDGKPSVTRIAAKIGEEHYSKPIMIDDYPNEGYKQVCTLSTIGGIVMLNTHGVSNPVIFRDIVDLANRRDCHGSPIFIGDNERFVVSASVRGSHVLLSTFPSKPTLCGVGVEEETQE